ASDGSLLWRNQGADGWLWHFDGVVFTSIPNLGLEALNPANGAIVWRYQTGDGVRLASTANGILYGVITHQTTSAGWSHALVALDAHTGKLLWRIALGTSEDFPLIG